MAKSRISYHDRLLMGSIGNLEGLRRRLPQFKGVDEARIRSTIEAADQLHGKLKSLLGSSSNLEPQQLTSTLAEQSSRRSAGQSERASRCSDS